VDAPRPVVANQVHAVEALLLAAVPAETVLQDVQTANKIRNPPNAVAAAAGVPAV